MTQLDRELDYEDFIDEYDEDFDSIDLDLEYRGYQRRWYLEDDNYRRLSDVIQDNQRLSPDGRVKTEAYAGRKMLGLTA